MYKSYLHEIKNKITIRILARGYCTLKYLKIFLWQKKLYVLEMTLKQSADFSWIVFIVVLSFLLSQSYSSLPFQMQLTNQVFHLHFDIFPPPSRVTRQLPTHIRRPASWLIQLNLRQRIKHQQPWRDHRSHLLTQRIPPSLPPLQVTPRGLPH